MASKPASAFLGGGCGTLDGVIGSVAHGRCGTAARPPALAHARHKARGAGHRT